MNSALRTDQKYLLGAGAFSILAWISEPLRWVMIPFVYLNTHLHELAHAVTAVGTGGSVGHIQVFQNGSGVTQVVGGDLLLVGSAGYVGAAALGGAYILAARTPHGARLGLQITAVTIALALVIWIRGDIVGVVSAGLWAGSLAALAKWGTDAVVRFSVALLGIFQGLTSLQSLLELLHISSARYGATDAELLARITGLPPLVWAIGWAVLSTVILGLSLRAAWGSPTHQKPKPR